MARNQPDTYRAITRKMPRWVSLPVRPVYLGCVVVDCLFTMNHIAVRLRAVAGNGNRSRVGGLKSRGPFCGGGASSAGCRCACPRARAVALESLLLDGELLDHLAERLAARVLERLRGGLGAPPESPEGLISAREVARVTGMTRRWVYDHAGDLEAVPLGSGAKPRLGFHPGRVRRYLEKSVARPEPLAMPVPHYKQRARRESAEQSAAMREPLAEIPPCDA